jgi:hypothetical protein
MNTVLIKGVVRNGRVEFIEPIDWPEGTEVVVTSKISEDDKPPTPDEIATTLDR